MAAAGGASCIVLRELRLECGSWVGGGVAEPCMPPCIAPVWLLCPVESVNLHIGQREERRGEGEVASCGVACIR